MKIGFVLFFLLIFLSSNFYSQSNKTKDITMDIKVLRNRNRVFIDSIYRVRKGYKKQIESSNDSSVVKRLKQKIQVLENLSKQNRIEDVKTRLQIAGSYPNSMTSLELLDAVVTSYQAMEFHEGFEIVYNSFSEEIKNSKNGKLFGERLHHFGQSKIGMKAPQFALNDIDGNLINLAELKGKHILIDFWASWCGPCRKEFSHLKNLNEKYSMLGFKIISISIDDNLKKWKGNSQTNIDELAQRLKEIFE